MAIPAKIIGASYEAQLLWNILYQIDIQRKVNTLALTNEILIDGTQVTQIVDGFNNPVFNSDIIDITSATVIYEGWKNNGDYKIRKTDISTPIITKMWAVGMWDDRATLIYQ